MFKRHGYRDGMPGLIFALHSATAMFKACALVWDEQNRVSRSEIEDQIVKSYPVEKQDEK
jgi:hypothetical protein